MIVINDKMMGKTTLDNGQTIMHGSKKSIDVVCRDCAKPFIESLQENGSLLNGSILCARCEKELAYVIEAPLKDKNNTGL